MAFSPTVGREPRGLWLAGIFTIALLLRLVCVWQLHSSGLWDYLRLDPLYYHDWALRIAQGQPTAGTYEMTPLYAWALGALFKTFGYGLMLPRILQAFAGAGTCAVVAWLGLRIFGRAEGLAAGLALALYGPALFHEAQIMKTVLTVTLSTATAAVLWRSGGSSPRLLAAGGALAGLTALAQENINITLPVLLAWIAMRAPRGRRLACGAALLIAYAIVVAPATIRNYAVSGDFVLITSGGGEVFYTGNNEQASGHYRPPAFVRPDPFFEHEDFRAEAARRLGRPSGAITRKESDAFWWREGMKFITGHPARYLALLWDKITTYFTAYERPDNYSYYNFRVFLPVLRLPLLHFGWIAPLGIVGLVWSARRWPELLPLHAVMGAYIVSALLFFTQDRYRMPMVPLLTLFAAHAAAQLVRGARSRAWKSVTIAAVSTALLALAVNRGPGNDIAFEAQNHGVLGEMHLRAGQPAEATEQFEEAIRLLAANPGLVTDEQQLRVLVSAHWGMVLGLEMQGNAPDDLLLEHLRGAAASPDADLRRDVLVRRLQIAESLHKAKDAARALAVVTEALADGEKGVPVDPVLLADAHYGLALIRLTDLPDAAEAAHHLRETLRLNPSHPRAGWIRDALARMGAP